jgi:hypothetical protein
MPAEEIIRYVLSFLGGGVISAGGNWAYTSWSARRAREWQSRYLGADYAPLGERAAPGPSRSLVITALPDCYGESDVPQALQFTASSVAQAGAGSSQIMGR